MNKKKIQEKLKEKLEAEMKEETIQAVKQGTKNEGLVEDWSEPRKGRCTPVNLEDHEPIQAQVDYVQDDLEVSIKVGIFGCSPVTCLHVYRLFGC